MILDVRGLGFWVDVEPNPHRDSDTAPRPRRLTSGLGARRGFSWLWGSGVLIAPVQLGPRRCGEGLVLGAEGVEALLLEFLQIEQRVVRPLVARISSSSLTWIASVSRFCVFWIRNTIRNVTMVVPVLMTSCQVSLKPKTGPVTIHTQ